MFLNAILAIASLFLVEKDQYSISQNDSTYLLSFKTLLVNIREQKVSPDSAKVEFCRIMAELRQRFPNHNEKDSTMVFPLSNSNYRAVGGAGKGFYARKYNLFDFSVTGSHPAHDIFIYDPDQDCIDNRKKDFVEVLSVGNGIVIALEKDWTPTSIYKGGNYVWIYDLDRGDLWYYAHLRKVDMTLGAIVLPGTVLGQVGRSGSSAANKRSDTHLHMMHLSLDSTLLPKPHNYYSWLKSARTIKKSAISVIE